MKTLNSIQLTTVVLATSLATIPSITNAADNVEFKWSGQISRAITFADNGTDDDVLFVDNNNSGTRLRLTGEMEIQPGLRDWNSLGNTVSG